MSHRLHPWLLAGLLGAPCAAWADSVPDTLAPPRVAAVRPQGQVLLGIERAGARLVAVGERGIIILSDDEGATWRSARTPVGVSLTAVTFTSAARGWAVGHRGVILGTTDGGDTWGVRLDGRQYAQRAEAQARAAVEGGDDGDAARRTLRNAEALTREGADKPFFDISFADERHGMAVGAYGLCAATADAGATWTDCAPLLPNPGALHLYAIGRHGPRVVVVGEQGLALRGDMARPADRFTPLTVPFTGSLFCIAVGGDGDMVAGGLHGKAFSLAPEASTFEPVASASDGSFAGATRLRNGGITFVNQLGQVLQHDRHQHRFILAATSPMPPLSDVVETASGALVAVGLRGALPVRPPSAPTRPQP